jgi:RNA polymerase sigma-70 factor (ECF subfamily)
VDSEFSLTGACDREQVQALIGQAREGSSHAVGQLIDGCRKYMLSIANQELPLELRAKLGPSDLVQDTAFEANRDFASFEGERLEQLLAWLRRILLNNATNASRRYQGTGKRDVTRELSLSMGTAGRGELVDDCPSPGARVAALEQQERVELSLQRLPRDMRSAILLRNREHLSFAEIGFQLDRSADAARKLWARAIERLRDELAGSDDPT